MKLLSLLPLLPLTLAAPRQSAPANCITVSPSSAHRTIQSAISSFSSSSSSPCIFIAPGTYKEQVTIPSTLGSLTIYGSTTNTGSYTSNTVLITGKRSQAQGLSNEDTATLRVRGKGLKMYNVDVENTYGEGSQAVALSSSTDSGFYGCRFKGFQDTVLSNVGKQVFVGCEIVGATDFVFGQQARTWFERVDLRVLARSKGYITANGREANGNSYYVFNNCAITAAKNAAVPAGAYYLGRPWRDHARVVFQKTSMTNVINPAGWSIWNTGNEQTCCVLFGEYGNTGAGASGKRAGFATKLSKAVGIEEVLGSGYKGEKWFDAAYFAAK